MTLPPSATRSVSRLALTRRSAILGSQLVSLCLLLATRPLAAQTGPFDHVSTERLKLPFAGAAVVRDSARWVTLWHRYGRPGPDRVVAPGSIPPVDFRTEMLIAVSPGPRSGCTNRVSLVREITQVGDSLIVQVGHHPDNDGGPRVTCTMIVYPVEVIRLPRHAGTVVFRGPDEWIARAAWWDEPSLEELAQMPERSRRTYWAALARDPATPLTTVSGIASRLSGWDWELAAFLVLREDVRGDPTVLTDLALLERDSGREARRVLFDRFGLHLARRDDTSPRSLHALVNELTGRHPPPQEISTALLRHTAVLGDRDLLIQLSRLLAPLPDLRAEACREILARYEVWDAVVDRSGTPTGTWSSRVPCPGLPPPPGSHPTALTGWIPAH